MKIRFVGLLTEAQIEKGLANYKTIEPSEGIFIKGGLSYSFTFKRGIATRVTIRRAPRITLLDETDVETSAPKAEEDATSVQETSFDEKYASLDGDYSRVVWVKSEDDARELLKMATEAGYQWSSDDELLLNINFDEYGDETAYWFNAETKEAEYCFVEWYKKRGAEVVEYKSELTDNFKVGDRVVTTGLSILVTGLSTLKNGLIGTIESFEEKNGDKLAIVVWDPSQGEDKLPESVRYGKVKGEILLENLRKVV